jgi:hypothetical protein
MLVTKYNFYGNVHNRPEQKITSYVSAPLGISFGDVMADFKKFYKAFDNAVMKTHNAG